MEACLAKVQDPWLRKLDLIGGIDQFADSTDVLSNPSTYRRLTSIYEKFARETRPRI